MPIEFKFNIMIVCSIWFILVSNNLSLFINYLINLFTFYM